MTKVSKLFKTIYLILAIITILEYLFVSGMFTSIIVLVLIDAAGVINLCFSLKEKNYFEAALFVVATAGLSMGYWKVLY